MLFFSSIAPGMLKNDNTITLYTCVNNKYAIDIQDHMTPRYRAVAVEVAKLKM